MLLILTLKIETDREPTTHIRERKNIPFFFSYLEYILGFMNFINIEFFCLNIKILNFFVSQGAATLLKISIL